MPYALHAPQADRGLLRRRSKGCEAVARCFAENATVIDERRTYTGRDAIRRWKAQASSQYSYVVEPVAIAAEGDRTIVTSHLTGNFPGSPVDLRFVFVLASDAIVSLEIAP
ncbi:nuclear transport factor 2 family protein [Bosea sp. RAF48]|jgi:ketosteroid isomerase-like protein